MIYDDLHIELARKHGSPDPEYNARIGNEIIALMDAWRHDEARLRLDELTNPGMRKDLENMIAFDLHCYCMPRPGQILPRNS